MMKNRSVLIVFWLLTIICCVADVCSAASKADSDEKEYFAVFMEGKKVGYSIESRVVVGNQVTTSVDFALTLSRIGVPVSIKIQARTFDTTDGKPLGFELEQVFGMMATKTIGSINEKDKITVQTNQQENEFDWPNGAVMAEGVRLLHLKHGLAEGTTYVAKFFDPSMMQFLDVEVKVGSKQNVDLLGRVLALTEVQSTISSPQIGSIKSTEYYDDDLRLQKSITPLMGMVVEQVACTKEFALSQNDVLDVIEKMFLASPEPLEDLDRAKSITYHLAPKQGALNLTLPTDDNQHVQHLNSGRVVVTVEPEAYRPGTTFPYKGSDETILEAMRPTRYLQSEHEKVIALARRAVGQTKDAAEAVKKIEAFVSDYVENRNLSVGYATAAEVADSRQGDCTEFAVLTAAMCRAVGIPSRVVVGMAYVSEFAGRQGFVGHAWTQAFVGGKWIGLDAVFKDVGRGGYDAGHIALAIGNGNPEDFFNLATTVGQFEIEKVIVRRE